MAVRDGEHRFPLQEAAGVRVSTYTHSGLEDTVVAWRKK